VAITLSLDKMLARTSPGTSGNGFSKAIANTVGPARKEAASADAAYVSRSQVKTRLPIGSACFSAAR
jgi:hypothetical protein